MAPSFPACLTTRARARRAWDPNLSIKFGTYISNSAWLDWALSQNGKIWLWTTGNVKILGSAITNRCRAHDSNSVRPNVKLDLKKNMEKQFKVKSSQKLIQYMEFIILLSSQFVWGGKQLYLNFFGWLIRSSLVEQSITWWRNIY